jgi:hypothetical protein
VVLDEKGEAKTTAASLKLREGVTIRFADGDKTALVGGQPKRPPRPRPGQGDLFS